MNDTKLKSLSEVGLNIGVGYWINFALNSALFPIFGIRWDFAVYSEIGGFYTISSVLCMYFLRRFFNKFAAKQNIKGSMTETALNTGIGFAFTYTTSLLILPYFGMTSIPNVTIVTLIGLVFTMIRRYLFRRMFNYFGKNENLYTLSIRLVNRIKRK